MKKNNHDLKKMVEEILIRSRSEIVSILSNKYKYDKEKAFTIEEIIYNSTRSELFDLFTFKGKTEDFIFSKYRNKYENLFKEYPDFVNWSWIALNIPYYQSLGDTIGYYNGEWEFNKGNIHAGPDYVNELVYDFINLGGVNDFNVKNLLASDDTILYLATMQVLCDGFDNINDFGEKIRKSYLDAEPLIVNRYPGSTTLNSLKFQKINKWNKLPYDSDSKGNGSVMRSGCIGIFFPGKFNRKRLISLAIESSRITHNSAIAILGSITSALFTAYALERVPIDKWPNKLQKILDSTIIDDYLKSTRPKEYEDFYVKDKRLFTGQWEKYRTLLLTGIKDIRLMKNLVSRYKYLVENFSKGCDTPGSCADDCLIMAYDSLLRCDGVFEKMLVYSVLHPGDSDTVGSITFSWFGGYYHSPNNELIVKKMFKDLEYSDKINELFEKSLPLMTKVYYYDIYLHFASKYLKKYAK